LVGLKIDEGDLKGFDETYGLIGECDCYVRSLEFIMEKFFFDKIKFNDEKKIFEIEDGINIDINVVREYLKNEKYDELDDYLKEDFLEELLYLKKLIGVMKLRNVLKKEISEVKERVGVYY
jgi:hypothetical protein